MSSPTDLQADNDPPSFLRPDGRWEHKLRQSWFKTLDHCPELARRDRIGDLPAHETDAACLGTAVHDSIEMCLHDVIEYGTPMTLDDMMTVSQRAFGEYMQLPGFRFVKTTEKTCRLHIDYAVAAWHTQVLPTLEPVAVEIPFNVVLHEDEKRVIKVKGTIDNLDARRGPIDWKTSGEPYTRDAWKYERYDVQSTIYTYALHEMGRIPTADTYPFTFVVMVKGKPVDKAIDTLTVTRTEAHWLWLQRKALSVARKIEAGTDEAWELGDSDWWCSPKWCPAWSTCRGELLSI